MADICTEPDCAKRVQARSLCHTHYMRKRRAGEFAGGRTHDVGMSIEQRLARNQERTSGGCIVWTKRKTAAGYGQIRHEGRSRAVHRLAWEIERGIPPSGMMVNHVCGNRACFNLDHLELQCHVGNSAYLTHPPRSKSGYRNVYQQPSGRYRCSVHHMGQTYGSMWDTAEEAHAQAKALRVELFGVEDYEDRWSHV